MLPIAMSNREVNSFHRQHVIDFYATFTDILLDTSGCLKFVDFGAAAVLTGGQGMDQRSRTPRATMVRDAHGDSTIKVGADPTGTPMYMAPEVIKTQLNGGRLGAMDLWAVGCVLLRCLTGRQPWPGLDHEWSAPMLLMHGLQDY